MKPEAKLTQSKIIPVVITGFLLILLLIAVSWVFSMQHVGNLTNVITQSRLTAKKMDIVALMSEIARSRTRLTMKMTHTEDIFERDEIALELDRKATEFTLLRQELVKLGLNEQEQALFNAQRKHIVTALKLQREAAELALSDHFEDREKATHILIQSVYPEQEKVIDYFIQLLDLMRTEFDSTAEKSLSDIDHFTNIGQFVMTLILMGSTGIVVFMVFSIRTVEKQLVIEKEKAQVTLRSIGDGVITVNKRGEIEYLNRVALDLLGETEHHLVGRPISSIFEEQFEADDASIWESINQILAGQNLLEESSDIRFGLINNPAQILKANISPIVDVHHQVSGVVISFRDVTKSQALLNKIQHQAAHDALTGLLNRRAFEEKVKQMMDIYNNNENHAFCIMDLDQFKIVNDSAGHAAGDELLKQLAQMMKPLLRKSDLLARLGGDEFGIFISNVSTHDAINIVEKLLNAIQAFGFYWEDNIYRVGASIGMVSVPAEIIDYQHLFQAADTACYIAKNEGRNQIYLMPLNDQLLVKKAEQSEQLQYLTQTLESGQFYLFGQSIVPLSARAEGRKHKEILLRMRDREGNTIPPMAFIPIAERYGLMADIDFWVIQQVCQHIVTSSEDDVVYAVNLSGQTLSSQDRMNEIMLAITDNKVPAGRLCLEITETAAIANLDVASKYMAILREYGCYIALDDFGSGLSSFSYLNNLPLDYIKIDGVFVKSMQQDETSVVMIEAIHHIGKKLGLFTVAEYVEDEETYELLKNIGIDMAQGYHFDKPSELISPV